MLKRKIKAVILTVIMVLSSLNVVNAEEIMPEEIFTSQASVVVDIKNQTVYMYKNGELIFDSPCVTGMQGRDDTHKGMFHITFTDTERTLRGSYGKSFVHYWMRFTDDGQGLHDATWRDTFGGDIYKTNGSHGCVNLPRGVAAYIHYNSYVGMPVYIY